MDPFSLSLRPTPSSPSLVQNPSRAPSPFHLPLVISVSLAIAKARSIRYHFSFGVANALCPRGHPKSWRGILLRFYNLGISSFHLNIGVLCMSLLLPPQAANRESAAAAREYVSVTGRCGAEQHEKIQHSQYCNLRERFEVPSYYANKECGATKTLKVCDD